MLSAHGLAEKKGDMTGLASSNASQGNQAEMRDVRRVGMYPAKSPTVLSKKIVPTKVAGYVGVVPNSSQAIPIATTEFRGNSSQRQPQSPAIMSNCTRLALAPRAIRIPIS